MHRPRTALSLYLSPSLSPHSSWPNRKNKTPLVFLDGNAVATQFAVPKQKKSHGINVEEGRIHRSSPIPDEFRLYNYPRNDSHVSETHAHSWRKQTALSTISSNKAPRIKAEVATLDQTRTLPDPFARLIHPVTNSTSHGQPNRTGRARCSGWRGRSR